LTKLDAALALAARGFKIFPIKAGKKAPPLWKDWPARATSEVTQFPQDANIGIHTVGMIVIDVDAKKGGNDALVYLQMAYDLPETLTTLTPTGGRHLFYTLPAGHGGVPNSVEGLGSGLDIRSTNGYVVGPGSETKDGTYTFQNDLPIAPAPEWLVLKLGTVMPKTGTPAEPVADASDALVDRAREWLRTAPRSVKGAGGDQTAYQVACHLRDLGVSEAQAGELMRSDAWDHGCGWRGGWLEQKPIRSAYRYAQNAPGVAAASPDDFPVIDMSAEPVAKLNKNRHVARRLSEFANSETKGPGYLVKGLLQRRSYAELFGAPGAGKTFVALDIAYHVAANVPWMGRKVHPGPVLYLAYEGTGGMVKRAQALRQKYGQEDVPLYVCGAAFSLREPAGRAALGQVLAEMPAKPVLIVIDTFARALMGGDENSAQDVGAFNSAVAALIESTGACVMIIHHSGKNKNAGARGSSALLGAIDTELEVDENKVTASKQRDVEMGEPTGFKLVPVVVGMDEDGDELTSCVVEPDVVKSGAHGRIVGNAKRGFDVLCELRPDNKPIVDREWKDACRGFLGTKSVDQRFYDLKSVLRKKGFIDVDLNGMCTRRLE